MVTTVRAETPPLRGRAEVDAALADLAEHGYCILERALSGEATAALGARVAEQAAGEIARGEGFVESGINQRVWMLPNKGRMFRDLILDPLVERFMGHLLGPQFLLSSLTANVARPGGAPMYLHRDQGYVDFWTEKPLVANLLFMLDDFSEANGATRLVPGSHLARERRPYAPEETVAAEGPAGSVMVFDGRLVHGTGANHAEGGERRALLAYHCRPFVRQQENYFLGLDPQIRRRERPQLLARLGFEIWAGLGRTGNPGQAGVLAPLEQPVGPLAADGQGRDDGAVLPAAALWDLA
ncbi:MAG TPA: phytanoyl-CoA dioxygenase family protein [Caulobacteraceae bacterium]|nr:phytanoyl-CoA dioxygenase family protein [Caulobacteraceae bacterium]